jgi:hypothetical protein
LPIVQQGGIEIALNFQVTSEGAKNMDSGMTQTCLQEAIRGKIADPQALPVASARVVLSGSQLGQKIATRTGSEGYFMFNRIPPGVYTLEVACAGFGKLVQQGIEVQEHAITGLDLKMDFQEDSRSLKLRALALEYIHDEPKKAQGLEAPPAAMRLREALAWLRLDRALFNPPAAARVGRSLDLEFGVYQNLKETILRRLRESRGNGFDGADLGLALTADLQAAGCRILPKTLPRREVSAARYLEWRWELMPCAFGQGLLRLDLRVSMDYKNVRLEERTLLLLDREIVIRKNPWLAWRRRLRDALGMEAQAGYPDR